MMGNATGKRNKIWVTPTVLQIEATECGAACLAMILSFYRCFVSLEQLRLDAGISRDGSRARNIVQAARKYGLVAKGYRKEPEALRRIKLPAILHWEFNHFVVLEGFKGDKAYLNDPAWGRRQVSLQELDESFTGVVLCFSPGENFTPGGVRSAWWAPLAAQLAASKGAFAYLLIAGLLAILPGLALPATARVYLDDIIIGNHNDWMLPLLGLITLLLLMQLAVQALRLGCLNRWQRSISTWMSGDFFGRLLKLPAGFFEGRNCGELVSRIRLNEQVASVIAGQLAPACLDVFTACFYLVLLLIYNPILTWIGLSFAAFQVAFVIGYSHWYALRSRKLIQNSTQLSGVAISGLTAIESLKAGGNEDDFFQRWSGFQAKFYDASQKLQLSEQLFGVVPAFFVSLGGVLIMAVGTEQIMRGQITVGSFIAFQALLAGFLAPVASLVNLGATLQNTKGSLQMLADVAREEGKPQPGRQNKRVQTTKRQSKAISLDDYFKGHLALELRQVTFGYNPQQEPLLQDFSLKLPRGQSLALLGASGSGKSTVAKLVSGLYQPWSGEIYLGGRRRRGLSPRTTARYLAVVEQEIRLFAGSVYDNITLWNDSVAKAEVEQVAAMACIDDFIQNLPGGYDYQLEEDGRNLSGGQRQRLELARALLLRPRLIVLDESTSALDTLTEASIVENLGRQGCACLVIAHRLSTVASCDYLMVIQGGKVAEQGKPEELLAKCGGIYRQLQEEDRK